MSNYIDTKEFVEQGYLQEANRKFFHPLGLALEVTADESGNMKITGVLDYRDNPTGIIFEPPVDEQHGKLRRAKTANINVQREVVNTERVKLDGIGGDGIQFDTFE